MTSSAAMRYVMQEIARAAERSVHVLLSGERGTGREMLARAIHARSRHSTGPFIALDCAKCTPHDLETQLFATSGHGTVERRSLERVRRTAQLFLSKGGTLFLQNIVDLPARLQTRLVRVLRDPMVPLAPLPVRIDVDRHAAQMRQVMEQRVPDVFRDLVALRDREMAGHRDGHLDV